MLTTSQLEGVKMIERLTHLKRENPIILRDLESNVYILKGTSLSAMNFTNEYMRVLSSSYGYFVKVAYIHPNVLNIIDSIIKINNTNF